MRYKSWENQKEKTQKEIEIIAKENENTLNENRDIIIEETIEKTEYDKKTGNKITSYETKKHNLSKQINETAKLLKIDQAQKLQELLFGITENKGE